MGSHSDNSVLDFDKFDARVSHDARDNSPAPGPKGRTNSTDIRGCGGRFSEDDEVGTTYPPHLDFSEEEDTDRQPQSSGHPSQSPFQPSPSRHGSPSLASRSSASSTPRTPTNPRTHLHRYLQPDYFHHPRTLSSDQHSDSSYISAHAYQPSNTTASTRHDENNNGDEDNDNNGGHTPYFTPSHTPSHHSVGTTSEDDLEGRAPDSPLPYSTVSLYNAQYGRGVVEGFEQVFHGQSITSAVGDKPPGTNDA
ncbi:hypothetical protein K505DRAFT_364284 [Melanomma pulvis-pyrius CBS 109.77]|uniref:Uncharacterized protein n=1 Tax=Melanomma pulvis-pyrius CBS 109.77 TaxID=1314802 RepID=A0A6A6X3U2_9PLEO|nr:hypothetical protein K505DRAFT_364284 [Melanomma pulvis-pyrius CBS 109.77]